MFCHLTITVMHLFFLMFELSAIALNVGCNRLYTYQQVDVQARWIIMDLSLCVRLAGEKPFNCPSDGCEKTFSSQYSLKSHIRGHDKGQPFSVTLSHPLSEVSRRAAARQCLPY